MQTDSLTFLDNRTGISYDFPITDGTIRTTDLRQIRKDAGDRGLKAYDPSFLNTASCRSKITFIDGDIGILRYRGFPIEQLAEQSTFLEVAWLLLYNELPTQAQLDNWVRDVKSETMLHENIRSFLDAFRYDAHPMGTLVGTIAALSTFYPDARNIHDPLSIRLQTRRLVAKMPTLAAFAYRHSQGFPYVYPDNDLTYTGNFLNMMFRRGEGPYQPHPTLERALEVLFILHADHEQNCSTSTMRVVGSTDADPFAAVAAAASALYGPLHGGANEAVLRMLAEIGDVSAIPEFIESVKRGERRLMGFGHRVYKNYDPRASIIKRVAYEVFEVTGRNRLLDIALELEKIALDDDYFVSRKLYPNVDFYSGIIYQALNLPTSMFTVMFAIPRTIGWIAQWREGLADPEQRISRPSEYYCGPLQRDYVPVDQRPGPAPVLREPCAEPGGDLTVTDNRNGKVYELAITDGAIRAIDLRKIKVDADDFGIMSYDPSFFNTAACRSSITEIDGERGALRFRGYPIEQLAEQSTFLETAYLLIYGELPTKEQLAQWLEDINRHNLAHENIMRFLQGFRYDADPISILIGAVSALSTFYPEARNVSDPQSVELQTRRLISKMPTLAAFAYRHSMGLPYVYPVDDFSYAGDFLRMMFKLTEKTYRPDPVLERALDVMFILQGDNGQSTSATTMRMVGSSLADPFVGVAAAIAALRGPKHGGAAQEVLDMLDEIGDPANVRAFVERAKWEKRLVMGFGHRIYKAYDPRATISRRLAEQVVATTGRPSARLDVALELERVASSDEYFLEHRLYPNIDFYSGIIYSTLGLPSSMFSVLCAIPRSAGWLAQWREMLNDQEQKIARPRQIYDGVWLRDYVPIGQRG